MVIWFWFEQSSVTLKIRLFFIFFCIIRCWNKRSFIYVPESHFSRFSSLIKFMPQHFFSYETETFRFFQSSTYKQCLSAFPLKCSSYNLSKGPFKYYVSKEVGGWGQKIEFFADWQYYLCWGRWVGLKKPKICWRNTWMVP